MMADKNKMQIIERKDSGNPIALNILAVEARIQFEEHAG